MTPGQILLKRRLELELTQEEAAKLIKPPVSQSQYQRWENAKRLRSDTLERLAVAFDIHEFRVTKTPASGSDAAGDMVPGLSISREMAEALERLPADDVDLIVRTIREFVLGPPEARTALESLHALIQRLKHAKQDTPPLGRSAP